MINISILGSTGSIGTQTLDIVKRTGDIKVIGLAAGRNVSALEQQIREFKPSFACLFDEKAANDLKSRVADLDVKVLSGMDWAAIVFNGEAMAAIDEDTTLQFAIPTEGSFMWVDAMTLSSKAPNIEGAYAFMNYILDAKIGAQLAKFINYATPNKASLQVIDDEFKNNRVINPTREEIDRMVFLRDPGDAAKLFDEAWTIVKTR